MGARKVRSGAKGHRREALKTFDAASRGASVKPKHKRRG